MTELEYIFTKKLCMKTWYSLISDFVGFSPIVYFGKYLKQFSTCYDSKCLNISGAKCFNSFCEWYIYSEILEQFGTWKLDIVKNLCEFCQFFLSDVWA